MCGSAVAVRTEVVVFGAGSLGSLVGGALAREHDVTLVGRDPHVTAVRDSGPRVEGAFDAVTTPTIDGTGLSGDVALVAVKAFDTPEAADALATGSFDAVCSLQNGMGNEETLAARVDCEVLAAVATCGAILRDPGVVECTGRGEVVVGTADGGASAVADRLAKAFESVEFDAAAAADMPRRLWTKLAVKRRRQRRDRARSRRQRRRPRRERQRAGANRRPPGRASSARPRREALEPRSRRTARSRRGRNRVERLLDAQDVEAGRRTEVDAINGYVVDAAREARSELDVDAPTNRVLTQLLRACETGAGVRDD